MPQSLSRIYIHLIFHVKTTSPKIREEDIERLHQYVGQLINTLGCTNVWVGGVEDHLHVVFALSKDTTISYVVEELKRNSSRWIKTIAPIYKWFAWQGGYAAFSVSQSVLDKTKEYVQNQREHHRRYTFKEEYLRFLQSYGIEYDERYVFRD